MRHSQLKAFHHVALLGGFSNAARALSLTQPAISEQVRRLEQEHDVLLFHRENKQVRLTSEGEELFLLTNQLFEVEQRIRDHLSESRAAVEGELRIIADSALHVTHFLGAFRTRYPRIHVNLRTGNTGDILEQLRHYQAEIGVVGSMTPGKDMEALDLGVSKIIGFSAKGFFKPERDSLSFSDFKTLPLILRETGSRTRHNLEEAARKRGVTLKPAIVAEGREAVREIVASGAGIGFVSRAEYGHDARLKPLEIEGIDIQMSETLVHLGQRRDVRMIRAFMEFARQFPSG